MSEIIDNNVRSVRKRIAAAAQKSGRSENDILLVAVSKMQPLEKIYQAHQAGVKFFGENKVQELVKKTLDKFGAIHILANNAGISRTSSILKMKEEDWDLVQAVDLKGVFLCTQAILGQMREQKYGKIINIASLAALGAYNPGAVAYAAAKAGVVSLTKSTAREAGPHGINVNCICSGRILTDMIFNVHGEEAGKRSIEDGKKLSLLGSVGIPEDIATLALFLASDESKFMTGQIIRMDGGRADIL